MLKLIFIVALGLSLGNADFNLHEICRNFPSCSWQGEGVYYSDREIVGVDTLFFDRLQNSVLNLKNLPSIRNVFVETDSSFDHLVMCQHITGNIRQINLRVGNKRHFCEVIQQSASFKTTTVIDSQGTNGGDRQTFASVDSQTTANTQINRPAVMPATESYQTPAATASTEDTFVPVTSDDEMFSTLTGQILTIVTTSAVCLIGLLWVLCRLCRNHSNRLRRNRETSNRLNELARIEASSSEEIFTTVKLD